MGVGLIYMGEARVITPGLFLFFMTGEGRLCKIYVSSSSSIDALLFFQHESSWNPELTGQATDKEGVRGIGDFLG